MLSFIVAVVVVTAVFGALLGRGEGSQVRATAVLSLSLVIV